METDHQHPITNIKVVNENYVDPVQLKRKQTLFNWVEYFNYLSNWVNSSMDPGIGTKSRIDQKRPVLLKRQSLISIPHFN